jgi:hypothetical protein
MLFYLFSFFQKINLFLLDLEQVLNFKYFEFVLQTSSDYIKHTNIFLTLDLSPDILFYDFYTFLFFFLLCKREKNTSYFQRMALTATLAAAIHIYLFSNAKEKITLLIFQRMSLFLFVFIATQKSLWTKSSRPLKYRCGPNLVG